MPPSTNTKTKLDLTKPVGIYLKPRLIVLQNYSYFYFEQKDCNIFPHFLIKLTQCVSKMEKTITFCDGFP